MDFIIWWSIFTALKPGNYIFAMPFVWIALTVVAAVVLFTYVDVPFWMTATVFAVSVLCAVIWHRHNASWLYVISAVVFFTGVMVGINRPVAVLPKNTRMAVSLRVTDNPIRSGKWDVATAIVEKFRFFDDNSAWTKAGEKVIARFDTLHNVSVGGRILTTARTGEIGNTKEYTGYVRLMKVRGYGSALWVNANENTEVLDGKYMGIKYLSSRMQAAANERLDRLDINPAAMGVIKGMSIGMRSDIEPETRVSYNITGAAHLLAVSGLHVGIVLMLVNLLLYPLPLLRNGHIVRGIIAVIAIWLYAMMTGASAPVIRAAIMFTGVQIALSVSRRGGGMNVLLGTAVIMLWINPNYLFDVSFQMSFVAMLGIFAIFQPLRSLVWSKLTFLNSVWGIVLIGFAAGMVTIPVVSYYFGRISLIGHFLNPVVVITANIIIFFSILWILFPIGALDGVFSAVLNFAGGFQNDVIDYAATLPWASIELKFNGWQLSVAYLILAGLAVSINRIARRNIKRREQLFGSYDT